jgi:DNA-binding NarL/FixJ family response regulator
VLVDDQELIRTGFALILSTAEGIEVVGQAGDGAEALHLIEALAADGSAPDVVLMDVRMPGMNGIEATGRIAREHPATRVVVLTTFDLDEYAIEAIEAGASGFLLKDARAAELIGAVRAVADGDSVMAPTVTRRLIERLRDSTTRRPAVAQEDAKGAGESDSLAQLTEREREVFDLIAEGLSNTEIGERLFLSESTVKTHVGRVLAKLQLRDRVHAVILAYEVGIR